VPASASTLSAGLATSMRSALDLGNHANKLARSLHSGSVASALREAIIGQAVPAGTPLVERTLAEQLGMSRGPIRNALYTLEGEGLVTTASNGRAFVTGFTTDDLRDLLAVRFQLESTAVRWGLERSADVAPVLALLEEMRHEGTSSQRLVDLDISFHLALLELSGSRFLVQSWQAIAPVIHTVITLGNRTLESRDPASNFNRIITSHRRIVAPMKTGNVDETVKRLADQFKFTGSMFEPPSAPPAPSRTR
jgi:DNA-binding GntR family transcriptional regulator